MSRESFVCLKTGEEGHADRGVWGRKGMLTEESGEEGHADFKTDTV